MSSEALYNQYNLLLPSQFDGGYLIIALDEKIEAGDLDEQFTLKEIEETLTEISHRFEQPSVRQWHHIKDNLFHYIIKNHLDEPGKYFLTDYAKSLLDMMRNKLNSPYKNQPLKKSFEEFFTLRIEEIKEIEDLERKFGRMVMSFPKKIITDHLEGLDDELREAYIKLNKLLGNDIQEAVALVKAFALTFRKFGERAEDITEVVRSKDKFLRELQMVVDQFFAAIDHTKLSTDEVLKNKKVEDWKRSSEIYKDIEKFFTIVDHKINASRRQIYNASEKLSELQEYFSTRANYRLQIQKLLGYVLQTAKYSANGIVLEKNFPLKSLVYEQSKMFYLRHHEFTKQQPNALIIIPSDEAYEREEQDKIEHEINRQQTINEWVNKVKQQLSERKNIVLDELMNTIFTEEKDFSIAYGVASEVVALASENPDINIEIKQQLTATQQNELALWKIKITT
ncbi:hypothetical protein [Pedobacter nototheniae]|uniref:hypothetical protein n=1 Tax=Pedobacter nototheniae TaxID=2488994 RepID=UPI0029308F47|nr:hypothetical protein [Pedobacter nototheniae]